MKSTLVKFGIALALLAWMVSDGRLDPSQLSVFSSQLKLVALAVAYWLIGPVILASIRWRILLSCAGYKLSLGSAIRLQLVGFFFTTVMPGSLGGDFVKVFYLLRDNPDKDRSAALWAILLDRLVGMCGLFLVGAVFIAFNFRMLWGIALLRPVMLVVFGYLAAFALFLAALQLLSNDFMPSPRRTGPLRRVIARFWEFMTACRIYRDHFPAIGLSVLLSTLAHGLSFVLFAGLAWGIWGHAGALSELGAVFPLGMLITTLPLSPGGLGVGHLAFEHLFSMVNLAQGANIYNAYFVSQLLLNLTGVVAYLGKNGTRAQAESIPVRLTLNPAKGR